MTTFSQLVDKMVLETKRPDLRAEICTYMNQTIRELHMEPTRGNIVHFRDNLKEEILVVNVSQGYYWDIPQPQVFQAIIGCRFDSVINQDGQPVWAREMPIGRAMNDVDHFFYRSGQRVFFKGCGGLNSRISLSWYEYPRSLTYFAASCRPCVVDLYGFDYADRFIAHDDDKMEAEKLCTNWILLRWEEVVAEGLRAKIYKRLSDTERARTSYAMYQSLRQGFVTAESADVSGSW